MGVVQSGGELRHGLGAAVAMAVQALLPRGACRC